MSLRDAQARYDAMTDEHDDDDITEMDLLTAYAALAVHDCDDLSGHRYRVCERRERKLRAHIAELERAETLRIEQLTQQLESALLCEAQIERVLREAKAARIACHRELQAALDGQINTIEEAA